MKMWLGSSLLLYNKIQEERYELNKALLSKKEPEVGNLENSQLIHMVKNEKACSEKNANHLIKRM